LHSFPTRRSSDLTNGELRITNGCYLRMSSEFFVCADLFWHSSFHISFVTRNSYFVIQQVYRIQVEEMMVLNLVKHVTELKKFRSIAKYDSVDVFVELVIVWRVFSDVAP